MEISIFNKKEYALTYDDKRVWIFTSTKDLMLELDRLGLQGIRIKLYSLFMDEEEINVVWKRIDNQAKKHNFVFKIVKDKNEGLLIRGTD